jgi:hypothetical protein
VRLALSQGLVRSGRVLSIRTPLSVYVQLALQNTPMRSSTPLPRGSRCSVEFALLNSE